jgi:hypothetical protein
MLSTAVQTLLDTYREVSLEDIGSLRFMDRVDTKFVFRAGLLPVLVGSLKESYSVLEIGGLRAFRYNTRYMDTADFLFFHQHVTGRLARHKIRFRNYESTGGAFLEIKMKTNKNRTRKWRIENDFNNDCSDEKAAQFISKHIPYSLNGLQPVLFNKFTRITLAGSGTCERITLDYDLSFSTMDGKSADLPFLAVAELKSEGFYNQSPFILSARKIGIRPTCFSKYCIGNALLRDLPRMNILKPQLLLLNKIENEYS